MKKYIQRYGASDRANHWVVAILFVILSLTGLAFFHPSFFFLTNVLGGPVWSRILHPFLGLVLAISFVFLARRGRHENFIKPVDN